MAEESSVYELEGLEKQLQSLLSRCSSEELRADSEPFCSDFRKLVEEYASRWQVPLPQLRILEIALRYFARASTFFASNCDHVLHTLSSLALSVFELLLFFDQKDFNQEPLKHFTVTFQECHLALAKHQNVHLLQVARSVQGGGPWASPALQAILSDSSLPQNEVDGCISSELPVFFELRVHYLVSCERISEAMALAKCCARHPPAGQHLFFLQVYLTWLYKTSQHDHLHNEVADVNGRDAVHMICSLECEEKDELLLALSTAFLSQQLCRGDMHYLCDLVLVWTKLHSRLNTSRQALLEEGHQLMLSATNVNSIFPFIRAILQEVGEDGIQFCMELCANALESCLPCDVITKSLIYKTIAGLLPDDLEVCRACALLVFFLERTVESYKMVYLLYMHPDQEYHVEYSPIGNNVRFETLQILKKDLYFDPEFWNLIALRTNCLKLMSEKVVSAALEEIMEDKWISNYCTKESAFRSSASVCQKGRKRALQAAARKRHPKDDKHHNEDTDAASKRLKVSPGRPRLNADHAGKKKGSHGPRPLKEAASEPLRRSFWQPDRIQDNGEHRRTTRLSEKNPPKRRIRKPRWLVEDSGTLERNNVPLKIKKHGLKHEKLHRSSVIQRSETDQIKNYVKHKPSVDCDLKAKEHQKGFSLDGPTPPPQVILELSLPDNELMGTFSEDACNRYRGLPQVLLYKPTVKLPTTCQPIKTVHRKEVILRARDAAMFVQQLHCYTRRQKGKGNGSNVHGSVSTITRSSVQGSPPKDPPSELCENPATEAKGGPASRTPAAAKVTKSPVLHQIPQAQSTRNVSESITLAGELPEKSAEVEVATSQTSAAAEVPEVPPAQAVASAGEPCEEPAVEMKVTIASQSPVLDKVPKAPSIEDVSQTSTADKKQKKVTDKTSVSNTGATDPAPSQSQGASHTDATKVSPKDSKGRVPCKNDTSPGSNALALSTASETEASYTPTDQGSISGISTLTLVTEMVTELAPERLARDLENDKHRAPGNSASKESRDKSKPKIPHRIRTTSSCSVPEQEASVVDVQGMKEGTPDIDSDTPENSEFMETPPESEESKLDFCCTFCNKVFKGSRVVAHAMFHYRKDECMFCRTMFKDDLLAMMHLSDHIEKLKRSKESVGNQDQENGVSDTKDISTPKTSAKAMTTNKSSGCRSKGRLRKSTNSPDLSHSESRKLRSDDKSVHGSSSREKQNASKHLSTKTAVHKVNGHIGKKKDFQRSKKDQDAEMDSSAASLHVDKESTEDTMKETESVQDLKTDTKQNGKVVEEKNVEPHEKVRCPVDGCAWLTDASKNRVALLYHALEDHYGEVEPLELAFRVGNGRCSICMRVLWSFEHFQHHVERHRLTPRHPCLHQGCTARFKTGMEMRRHTRKHSPLQAECCLPSCSQLFICLWALNLHEREHYASKSTKPDKNTNVQTGDKHNDTPVGKKRQDQSSKDSTVPTAVNKAARKLREQAAHDLPTGKHVKTSLSAGRASAIKEESKERNESKDSNVLKNLSNKDTSAQPPLPNLRFRQTLRKGQVNTTAAAPKIHRVISSSLLKHSSKLRHKLKKKQVKVNTKGPKRRGRPPKPHKAVHDENTTAGQEKTAPQKDPKTPAQLPSQETVEIATVSDNLKEEEKSQQIRDGVKTAEMLTDESKSKKSAGKQIKRNHIKQKGSSHSSSPSNSLKQLVAATSQLKTQKSNAAKIKKMHKMKNCSAPSSISTKHKIAESKKNHPNQEPGIPSSSKKPAKSKSAAPQVETKAAAAVESSADDEGKAKVESTDCTQAVPAHSLNAPPTTEKMQKVKREDKSRKPHIAKEGKKSASLDSSRRREDVHKKGDKSAEEKQPSKTSASSQCEVQRQHAAASVQSALDEEGKGKEDASDATLDSSGPFLPAVLNEETRPVPQKVTKKGKSNKSNATKNSDPSKAKKKRKDIHKEDKKIVKKRRKDTPPASKKPAKSTAQVQPLAEVKEVGESAVEGGKTSAETPPSTASGPGYTLIMNGQASSDAKSTVCKDTLEKYSKRPYMRLPPTAYLDEKYITMPKRRKEMSFPPSTLRSPPPETACAVAAAAAEAAAAAAAVQRQRCANCFATFNSAEELQGHLQLQKCSSLFGFDSDDEGSVFN